MIITLDELKNSRDIPTDLSDDRLNQLIQSAQEYIEEKTHQNWEKTSQTHIAHGQYVNGGHLITLEETPVASIESVTIDGTILEYVTDYTFDGGPGVVYFSNELPCTGFNNIQIQYHSGPEETPQTIKEVCMDLIVRYLEADPTGEKIQSFSDGAISITFKSDTTIDERLNPFIRDSPMVFI